MKKTQFAFGIAAVVFQTAGLAAFVFGDFFLAELPGTVLRLAALILLGLGCACWAGQIMVLVRRPRRLSSAPERGKQG